MSRLGSTLAVGLEKRGHSTLSASSLLSGATGQGVAKCHVTVSDPGFKPLKEFFELLEYLGLIERQLIANATCYRAGSTLLNRW